MYKLPPYYSTNLNLQPSNIVYPLPRLYKVSAVGRIFLFQLVLKVIVFQNNLADIANAVPQQNDSSLTEEEMAQLKSITDQQTAIFKKLSDMR